MDQTGKARKIIVTGANKGIGYEIAKALYASQTPYHIVFTSRSVELGEKALEKIKLEVPDSNNKIELKQLEVNDPKSIENFVQYVQDSLKEIDVLVNNAGYGTTKETIETSVLTLNTNFFSLVELTEKLLPFLAADGKIIQLSSGLGNLNHQGENIKEKMQNSELTLDELKSIANELMEATKQGKTESLGWSALAYNNSKCLLNAYTRWVLPRSLKENQQCYCCSPGHCRTDMTSPEAPLSAEEGSRTVIFLVQLPFVKDEKFHGKFVRKDYTEAY